MCNTHNLEHICVHILNSLLNIQIHKNRNFHYFNKFTGYVNHFLFKENDSHLALNSESNLNLTYSLIINLTGYDTRSSGVFMTR